MINLTAPKKWLQVKKVYQPFLSDSLREKIRESETYPHEAIKQIIWKIGINFKKFRNGLSKELKSAKKEYIEKRFSNTRDY